MEHTPKEGAGRPLYVSAPILQNGDPAKQTQQPSAAPALPARPAWQPGPGYLAAALALSLFCVKHSTALQTYGGGNYLLGGTYLFLFVMGMIAADMQIVIRYRSRAFFCAAVATVIYAAALVFLLKDRLALDEALFGWLLLGLSASAQFAPASAKTPPCEAHLFTLAGSVLQECVATYESIRSRLSTWQPSPLLLPGFR